MVDHKLKCWPEYFEKLSNNEKQFEIRRDDRGFKVGDVLLLCEWLPLFSHYTGRQIQKRIVYILDKHEGLKEGFVIFQMENWHA